MEYFELFGTQAEALGFIKGIEAAIECLDSDHLQVSAYPEYVNMTGEWRVTYRSFA